MVQSAHKARVYSLEAIKVLAVLGALGTVLVLPNTAILLDELMKRMDKRSAKKTVSYLKYKKLVDVREEPDGSVSYKLTQKGQRSYRRYQINTLSISTPPNWDGKWRMVIFDLPKRKKTERQQLLDALKQLNFYMLQRSTWVHPFDCQLQIGIIAESLGIEKYLSYMVVEQGNFQQHTEKHFKDRGLLV